MALSTETRSAVLDIANAVTRVTDLNEALFLAATGIGDGRHCSALQALSDEVEQKLLAIANDLEKLMEDDNG